MLNNPGLKSGVIDNKLIADFSPKHVILVNAESPGLWTFINPGLKSWIIDNELIADFSPKHVILVNVESLDFMDV